MTIEDTDPLTITGGSLQAEQVCFHLDARADAIADDRGLVNDDTYTDGAAAFLAQEGQFMEYQITPDYTITSENFAVQFALDAQADGDFEFDFLVNGESVLTGNPAISDGVLVGYDWYSPDFFTGLNPVELEAGETYTLRFEITNADGAGGAIVDRLAVYDNEYESQLTFDNTVDGNQQLSGPELFANEVPIELSQTETRRDVTEANIESTWDDTSNGQYIELRIGDDAFSRSNNSETASTTGGPARSIDVTFGLSRYGTRTNDTPTEGFLGQSVDVYELFANPSAVNPNSLGTAEVDAVVPPGSITGDRLEEAGQLASDDALLTRSVLAPFDVFENMEIRSSEKVGFDNE